MNNHSSNIPVKSPIFFDSSCFIYTFEKHPIYHDLVKPIFNMLSENSIKGLTSIITVTEVLTAPFKEKKDELVEYYLNIFSQTPQLSILLPFFQTSIEAAKIRAEYNFNTPDAYQLALAKEAGCKSFLTNDKNLKKFKRFKILILDEFMTSSPL